MRNMARFTTAKSFIFFYTFSNGLHFPLLTVGTLKRNGDHYKDQKVGKMNALRTQEI
jgi:hypothetical protein